MQKEKQPAKPIELPIPHKHPETVVPPDPEEPMVPNEDPDTIPEEDPFETPPYELPTPGEGP